jgi:hypothetical protein
MVDYYLHANQTPPSILATFDTTPSPHGRINDPSLLLAFAHIRGELLLLPLPAMVMTPLLLLPAMVMAPLLLLL